MADKKSKQKSALIGNQAAPTTLSTTTKLDIDTKKILVDTIIDSGLNGGLNTSELEKFTNVSNNRDQIYQIIDTMAKDSAVSSIIKTYADSACETADNGHIVWCEAQDSKVSKFINYLLNVMNVDKNVYGWAYCLVKYGDTYLRLFRESDYKDTLFNKENIDKTYSARNMLTEEAKKTLQENINLNIHSVNDPYSYYIEMIPDPGTMFELTKYGTTYGYIEVPNQETSFDVTNAYVGSGDYSYANYKMKSNEVNVYQADDFVHAYLEDNFTRYPERVELFTNDKDFKKNTHASMYTVRRGKSMLIDNYKVWREKSLLESSILLNRVTKSSIVRKVAVEVGDMPKEQVSLVLRRVKELFEQKTAVNTNNSMSDYNNPGPVENNVYFATHNGQGAITIDAVGGDVDVKNLADLDSWVNKFYSGFGVPKAYYGWTDDGAGFNGGKSLSIISSVFAKGVKHVQNSLIQAITDAINLILINKGLKAYLNNFTIKMKAPITQEELDARSNLAERANGISTLNSLFADVEDKTRRLTILKDLISTLNYGDNITAAIDSEIAAIAEKNKRDEEAAKKEAEEQAKLEAEEAKKNTENIQVEKQDLKVPKTKKESEKPTIPSPSDIDLGISGVANESLKINKETSLNEGPDFLIENNDLPTPEQADSNKDFSKNE